MGHKCLSIIALSFMLITFVAIAISFSCPEWYHANLKSSGLWLDCNLSITGIRWRECKWYFANNFELQNEKHAWFVAVQVLYSVALGFSVFSVLAAASTCLNVTGKANSIACGLINFTFLLLVAAVATFGAMSYTKLDVRVAGSAMTFGWTFWVAVGSSGLSLITTILYYCLSRVEDFGSGYK